VGAEQVQQIKTSAAQTQAQMEGWTFRIEWSKPKKMLGNDGKSPWNMLENVGK